MSIFTFEQKNFIFEIYYRIKASKTLTFENDFVRLFNEKYKDTTTNIQSLRYVIKNKNQVNRLIVMFLINFY